MSDPGSVRPPTRGRFSVIVPTLQQARFLGRTLQSIFAQDDADVEIIVQDGGSTDGTTEILQQYVGRLRWESRPDDGQTAAINAGLRKATGEYLCYLNSDDVFYPDALRKVHGYFVAHPEADVIYGMADFIDEQDRLIGPFPIQPWNYADLLETNFVSQPACFWRRSVYDRFGAFDETLHYTMDYEYWLRVGASTPFHFLAERLAASRCHLSTKTFGQGLRSHTEIVALLQRYNDGRVPPRAIASYARHRAGVQLGQGYGPLVERSRFAASYWYHLARLAPKVTRGGGRLLLQRIVPPYSSARRRTEDPAGYLKADLALQIARRAGERVA
ncbi:MAG TPA: glycosyltransferase family 2 protein [Verrucomicrobiae bacterium]|nr:glycosyltransferase family 2 protein [Verrucomicrobiae bacterium]